MSEPVFTRNLRILGVTLITWLRVELLLVALCVVSFTWVIFEVNRVKVSQDQLKVVVCQLTQAVVKTFPHEVDDPDLRKAIVRYHCPVPTQAPK